MLLKLTELHFNPPPAISMGHGNMAGEGSGGTEPVVGSSAEGRKPPISHRQGQRVMVDLVAGRSVLGTRSLGEPFLTSGVAEEAGSRLGVVDVRVTQLEEAA